MSYLIISCSLNPESKSKILAQELAKNLQAKTQDFKFIDLKDYPLPLCDGDQSYNDPNVGILTNEINNAQVIILAVPIYNYYANAAVKNLIELTGSAWENKTVAFLCAAGGNSSYMSIMNLANSLMLDFRCLIVPRFVYATGKDFGNDEVATDEIKARIAQLLSETMFLHDRLN